MSVGADAGGTRWGRTTSKGRAVSHPPARRAVPAIHGERPSGRRRLHHGGDAFRGGLAASSPRGRGGARRRGGPRKHSRCLFTGGHRRSSWIDGESLSIPGQIQNPRRFVPQARTMGRRIAYTLGMATRRRKIAFLSAKSDSLQAHPPVRPAIRLVFDPEPPRFARRVG